MSAKSFTSWKVPPRIIDGERENRLPGSRGSMRATPMLGRESHFLNLPPVVVDHDRTAQSVRSSRHSSAASKYSGLSARSLPRCSAVDDKPDKHLLKTMMELHDHTVPSPSKHWFKGASRDLKKWPEEEEDKKGTEADVTKWLKESSARDRQLAAMFFGSPAGQKLVEKLTDKSKTEEVIVSLKRNKNLATLRRDGTKDSSEITHLRYLRLLTPTTREQSKQYQTWHHLPEKRIADPNTVTSALFTIPHRYIPTHFSIHPDWGEN